jgi:protein involved in polysaccharide export with SLBB domain/Mrp family chromosome partitioning ATPase
MNRPKPPAEEYSVQQQFADRQDVLEAPRFRPVEESRHTKPSPRSTPASSLAESHPTAESFLKEHDPENPLSALDIPTLLLAARHLLWIPVTLTIALIITSIPIAQRLRTESYAATSLLFYQEPAHVDKNSLIGPRLSRRTAIDMVTMPSTIQSALQKLEWPDGTHRVSQQCTLEERSKSSILDLRVGGVPARTDAIDAANMLALAAIDRNKQFYRDQAAEAFDTFNLISQTAQSEMTLVSRELAAFQSTNRVFELGTEYQSYLDSSSRLAERVSAAQIRKETLETQIQVYRKMIEQLPEKVVIQTLESSPLRRRITNTEVALMEARTQYAPQNPKIKLIERELSEMRKLDNSHSVSNSSERVMGPNTVRTKIEMDLLRSEASYAAAVEELATLRAENVTLEKQFEKLPRVQAEYARLRLHHDNAKDRLTRAQNQLKQIVASSQTDRCDLAIFEPASSAHLEPSTVWLIPIAGGLLGGFTGLAVILGIVLISGRIHSQQQLERLYSIGHTTEMPNLQPDSCDAPLHALAPVCRTIEGQLDMELGHRTHSTIGLFSAHRHEGKTILASALAAHYTSLGEKVARVDLTYPTHPIESQPAHGIEHYLRDEIPFEEIAIPTQGTDHYQFQNNSAEIHRLMRGTSMARFWERLATTYSVVLVEAEAVLDSVDLPVLSGQVDASIVIIDQTATTRVFLDATLERLQMESLRPATLVLNRVPERFLGKIDQQVWHEKQNVWNGIRTHLASISLLLLLMIPGCKTPTPVVVQPTPSEPEAPAVRPALQPPEALLNPHSAKPYRFAIGDIVELSVFGQRDMLSETIVAPDGSIYFSFLNALHVEGQTLPEVKTTLEQLLAPYFNSAQISLIPKSRSNNRFCILGKVDRPGRYPLETSTQLSQAIAIAGGITEGIYRGTSVRVDNLKDSYLLRNNQCLPINMEALLDYGDTSQDVYIHPGDVIYIASGLGREVYLLGAVSESKAVAFTDRMTLVELVAGSSDRGGGYHENAHLSQVTLLRGDIDSPHAMEIDLQRILSGQDPDLLLAPGDIVYLPHKPYPLFKNLTRVALSSFVKTFAGNAGADLVGEAVFSEREDTP